MKKIWLVPIDESERSMDAIEYAVELALETRSMVELLNVQPKFHTYYAQRKVGQKNLQAFKNDAAKAIFKKGMERVNNRVDVIVKMKHGIPAVEICHEAREAQVKGIIMAPRKKRKKFGSVSQQIIHQAPCPVIIIPVKDLA